MGKLILIIDDDGDFADAMSTLLESSGYRVDYASSGEQGFEMAERLSPDLILLDVMMTTKTEGFDLSRKLTAEESTKKIPVILVTGIRRDLNIPYSFEPDEEWLPVKAVIEKPIRPETLLKTVAEHI
ncbi:MAG TPA: response regulator [Spirochaetia bacterium]|nr:response regulator [Spirochaetia bacterium]